MRTVEIYDSTGSRLRLSDSAADAVRHRRRWKVVEMGVQPVQIHVMSLVDGVTWDEVWRGRGIRRCGRAVVCTVARPPPRREASAGVGQNLGSGAPEHAGRRPGSDDDNRGEEAITRCRDRVFAWHDGIDRSGG